ncbi:MAG: hypothetical protein QF921_00115 [Pseudomonadales bacterium]|jgi:hypothetical protein|nr:hypothetical protein [Pseudomonadales bacterium]MDP6472545.1 hypothetical protein [Pseudomonadales bacterium]MDP6829027.1 hypothetical protein [Pseudomonadales bacterium]MDP6969921.1 hypothetical protein [Pseudomonadales bacterium]|tara:strand:- start:301 stop:1239 length:939 start_codon:yes stop_codon:yes gene_type:complete
MTADPVLRLRQICLLARDLEWTSNILSTAFDAPVVFRDPRMAAGGYLTNTHIRLGDSFLETVSPTDLAWARSSTQTRLLERNGDCGYMAIVQVPDVSIASRSMAVQGSGRGIVAGDWNICPGSPGSGLAGVESGRYVLGDPLLKAPRTVSGVNVQFHPGDFGTLAEIQENWPGHGDFPGNKGVYFPAGNAWQNGVDARPHGGVTTGFAAVEIAPRDDDPKEVCKRWMNGLGAGCSIDPAQPATLRLSGGQTMRFVEPAPGKRTGVVGVDLWAIPSVDKRFDSMNICGVKWTLLDHPDHVSEETEETEETLPG